jgi:hypothetical protein
MKVENTFIQKLNNYMFTSTDPNTVILGGPNSQLNPYWNFIPDTKNYLRMLKLEKIYKWNKIKYI